MRVLAALTSTHTTAHKRATLHEAGGGHKKHKQKQKKKSSLRERQKRKEKKREARCEKKKNLKKWGTRLRWV